MSRNGSYRGSRSPSARSYTKSRSRSKSRERRSRSGSYKHSGSRRRSPSPYHRSRQSGSSNYGGSGHDRLNPTPSSVLGIFGLSMHTTERDLKDIFSKYGKLTQVRLIIDKRTNKSRGFGFVYFDKVDDAKEAKKKCHGYEVDGKNIRVDYSIGERDYSQLPPSRPPPYRYSNNRYRDRSPYGGGSPYNSRRERGSPVYKRYSRSRSRSYDNRRNYRRSNSYHRR